MRIASQTLIVGILALVVCSDVARGTARGAEPLPGLLVAEVTVKDAATFEAYAAKSRPVVVAHKGAPLFRATNPTALFGEHRHRVLIGFRFPSKAAIREFYSTAEYQALIPLRTTAADVVFTAYEIAQEGPSEDMRALLAVNITVKDAGRFGEYGEASRPIVEAHGGKLLLRAVNPEVLFGEQRHKMLVLFKFPDRRALRDFYASEAYQKLIPTRTAAADVVFTGYDL
jgi:uncharacterized protein (DUF1330 family)